MYRRDMRNPAFGASIGLGGLSRRSRPSIGTAVMRLVVGTWESRGRVAALTDASPGAWVAMAARTGRSSGRKPSPTERRPWKP